MDCTGLGDFPYVTKIRLSSGKSSLGVCRLIFRVNFALNFLVQVFALQVQYARDTFL